MEFEYDNKVGKLGSSPFARLADQQKGATREFAFQMNPNKLRTVPNHSCMPAVDRNFGSQIKSPSPVRNPTFNVPALPQTPNPKSHNHVPAPFREQVDIDMDFSSAAESSPENGGNGADTEDTPDVKSMNNVTVFRGASASKTKSPPVRRQSWFQKFKTKHTANANALVRRSHKRRRREVEKEDQQISWRRPDDDSDYNDSRPSSSEGPKDKRSFNKKAKDMGMIPAILSFIHEHPHLPTILAFYGQMLFSLFILVLLGWGIWNIWGAISQQIEIEAEKLGLDVLLEVRQCEKSWYANRCDDGRNVAPALERMCDDWDHCRSQDWKAQGRAKIGAHTFASILNNFVEPLSFKFLMCAGALVFLLVFSPHQLFGQVRKASEAHLQQQQQQQSQPMGASFVPQTPSRQMQNEWANSGFFTPQTQSRQWESTDWGSPSKRLDGRSRSPAKQLEFRGYS